MLKEFDNRGIIVICLSYHPPWPLFTAIGVSFNCCSKFYPGSKAMSELEIRAVTDFVRSRKDSFLCFLSIHSYGQKLLIPYGHPKYTAPNYDELVFMATNAMMLFFLINIHTYASL